MKNPMVTYIRRRTAMRAKVITAIVVLGAWSCSDRPTDPGATSPRVNDSSTALFVVEGGALANFETYEDAAASLGGYTDAIASAGVPNWTGSTVSTLGYFQHKYANRVVGDARITTFLGATRTRQSSWLTASLSRVSGGMGEWEHLQKSASVSLTGSCGLSAQAEAKMTALYVTLVQTTLTTIFSMPDSDESWGDQGACSGVVEDLYEPTGETQGGGGEWCWFGTIYDWYRWDYFAGRYQYMGEVCLNTQLITGVVFPGSSPGAVAPPAAKTRSQVTLAVTSVLPRDTPVKVLRRAHQVPQEIVVVDARATSEDLVVALATLGALRVRDGDALTVDVEQAPNAKLNPGSQLQHEVKRSRALLAQLRKAPKAIVTGIGTVQTLDVDLGKAPQRGKP